MAADPGAGRQDIDSRMQIGGPDHFPDVDADPVAQHRQFIGEGDIDGRENEFSASLDSSAARAVVTASLPVTNFS